jgi:DNA-cytosine methyltransferase
VSRKTQFKIKKKDMNVLSLFDGMSCGQIALEKAGIKVDNYFASEIDKYAIQVTKHNYPNTKHIGDVTQVKGADLPKIDLLCGGSPCQGFSFAGKQLNFDDPRSKLFFEFVRLLEETKPKYFLLENVKMKKEYQDIISKYMGCEPVIINSSLVSAQNRVRLYWTNISDITQPKDKEIVISDITEDGFGKIGAIRGRYIVDGKRQDAKMKTAGLTIQRIELRKDEKSNCITTVGKDNLVIKKIMNVNLSGNGMNGWVYDTDCKAPTLTTNKGERTKIGMYQLNPSLESNGIQPFQQNRIYDVNGKNAALSGSLGGRYKIGYIDGQAIIYRTLTPIECERLQTVPDKEIICVFVLCKEQVKNYVNAVEQNPKLLKLALSAEKEELKEFVKLAIQNTKQSNPKTKFIVPQNADMQIQRQTGQCIENNQKESNTNADNAENIAMSKSQEQGEDSVLQNAFISITEGRIMHFGKEELPLKDKSCTRQLSGNKPLKLSGKEIMELVRDVGAGMKKKKDMSSTYTTLSVLSTNSIEQMLTTYYLFAKSAITGYTQDTISQKNISIQFKVNEGYTNHVSNSQRYKMLGNGWTVEVIKHIFSFLNGFEKAKECI